MTASCGNMPSGGDCTRVTVNGAGLNGVALLDRQLHNNAATANNAKMMGVVFFIVMSKR